MIDFHNSTQNVGDEEVNTVVMENDYGFSTLTVEAGTNGFHGGDYGHGSRIYLSFKHADGLFDFESSDGHVTITSGGDAEVRAIIETLRFAISILDLQIQQPFNCRKARKELKL